MKTDPTRIWRRRLSVEVLVLILASILGHQSVHALQVVAPRLPPSEKAVQRAVGSVLTEYYDYWRDVPAGPRYPCFAARGQDCFGPDPDGGCSARTRECRSEEEVSAFLDRLLELAKEYPESPLPLTHAVYAAVKFGDFDVARDLAEGCAPTAEWWCELAAGYVFHRSGLSIASEPHFYRALSTMPDRLRCGLEDVGPLLPSDLQAAYGEIPCDARTEHHAWFWWLADPFLVEAGNDRWAEHMARGFERMLNDDLNERVRSETLFRPRGYAPPAYDIRRGFPDSRDVSWRSGGTNRVRVTTILWRSRAGAFNHFVPDTLSLSRLDDDLRYRLEAEIPFRPTTNGAGDEGYTRPAGAVLQVPTQVARFRIGDSLEVALGSDLESTGIGARGEAFLVAGESPQEVLTLGPVPLQRTVRFQARLTNRRQLVGIEVMTPGADGRRRQVLLPLRAEGQSVSDLLLFQSVGSGLPDTRDSAVALMYGTVRVPRDQVLGVCWETYGLMTGDDLRISIQLESVERGWVSRALRAVGIGDEESGTVSWQAPVKQPGPLLTAVALNIDGVDPGAYDLVVQVRTSQGTQLTRKRRFEVVDASDAGN